MNNDLSFFLFFLSPTITNDTHILSPSFRVIQVFDFLAFQLQAKGLLVLVHKCVA